MTWRYCALAVASPGRPCAVHLPWVWLPHPLLANAAIDHLGRDHSGRDDGGHTAGRRVALALSIPVYYLVVGYLVPPSFSNTLGASQAGWEGPLRVSLTVLPFAVLLCVALVVALRTVRHAPAGSREA